MAHFLRDLLPDEDAGRYMPFAEADVPEGEQLHIDYILRRHIDDLKDMDTPDGPRRALMDVTGTIFYVDYRLGPEPPKE